MQMPKSLFPLLLYVNHALVANFNAANMYLRLFAKIKFSRKFPNLQYSATIGPLARHADGGPVI